MLQECFYKIKKRTSKVIDTWKECRLVVPKNVADTFEIIDLDKLMELTNTLSIWIEKGVNMTNGELILAWTNLGAIVEAWLIFVYCVYLEDYENDPKKIKRYEKEIEPKDASFDQLKEYSVSRLWESRDALEYKWVDKVQRYRNSIHFSKKVDIGTGKEFIDDINFFYKFIDDIIIRLPQIDDWIREIKQIYQKYYV